MARLVWRDDVADNVVQEVEGSARPVDLTDGYAHWFFRYAREFRRTAEIEKNDEADFSYAATISYGARSSRGSWRNRSFARTTILRAVTMKVSFDQAAGASGDAFSVLLPLRKSSIGEADPKQPEIDVRGRGITGETVLVAIIDDSFNPAHQEFLFKEGEQWRCRFETLWVQDAPARENGTVRYGREVMPGEVERLLNSNPRLTEGQILDRLEITRGRGREYSPSPLHMRFSHGCHVASIAAGYGPDELDGEDAWLAGKIRVIGVQIPVLASQDSSGATQLAATFDAINHVFERAAQIGEALCAPVPVILNFSYGLSSGARDGAYILESQLKASIERYQEKMSELGHGEPYVEAVLPAGNAHLTQTHIATDVAQELGPKRLDATFRVAHDDRTSSFIELWCPRGATDVFLTLEAPGVARERFAISDALAREPGAARAWILVAAADSGERPPERAAARVAVDTPLDPGPPSADALARHAPWSSYSRILIALAPTTRIDHKLPVAPAGDWNLSLEALVPVDGVLEGWILRDENVSHVAPRGRQSHFHSRITDTSRFDAMTDWNVDEYPDGAIRRNGTLSSLATAKRGKPWRERSRKQQKPQGEAQEAAQMAELVAEEAKSRRRSNDCITIVGGGYAHNLAVAPYSAAGSARIPAPEYVAPTETSRAIAGILGCGSRSGACVALNGTSVAAPQIARIIAEAAAKALQAGDPLPKVTGILEPLTLPRPTSPSPERETLTKRSARLERLSGGQLYHDPSKPRHGFHSASQARRMRLRFRPED